MAAAAVPVPIGTAAVSGPRLAKNVRTLVRCYTDDALYRAGHELDRLVSATRSVPLSKPC
jgi:hypothetical protein